MKKILCALGFLILCSLNVNAVGDTNISVNTQGIELCIAADNIDNYVCNSTEILTISGTQDHTLFFIPSMPLKSNSTRSEQLSYLALEPAYLLLGSGALIGSIIAALGLMFLLLRISGVL